jgi:hypothetical protein
MRISKDSGPCQCAGGFVDDAQVEQDPVGGIERRVVVAPALPGAVLSAPARVGELVEVVQCQTLEWPCALDEQTPD